MRTRAKQKHVVNDRARRENVQGTFFYYPKIRGVKITCVILGNPVKYGQKIT